LAPACAGCKRMRSLHALRALQWLPCSTEPQAHSGPNSAKIRRPADGGSGAEARDRDKHPTMEPGKLPVPRSAAATFLPLLLALLQQLHQRGGRGVTLFQPHLPPMHVLFCFSPLFLKWHATRFGTVVAPHSAAVAQRCLEVWGGCAGNRASGLGHAVQHHLPESRILSDIMLATTTTRPRHCRHGVVTPSRLRGRPGCQARNLPVSHSRGPSPVLIWMGTCVRTLQSHHHQRAAQLCHVWFETGAGPATRMRSDAIT
jgi:hypothetical protein